MGERTVKRGKTFQYQKEIEITMRRTRFHTGETFVVSEKEEHDKVCGGFS